MDDVSPDVLYGGTLPPRLVRWAVLVALVVVVAVGAAAAFGPPRFRPWRCHHTVERSTAKGAVDAYYESCWQRPQRFDAFDGNGDVFSPYSDWYDVDEFSAYYSDGKLRFLMVGRRSAESPWIVMGEGTGP
jgi:hypothetical protein